MSPIYAAFAEALNGATTIVAFGATERFSIDAKTRLDENLKVYELRERERERETARD